MAVLLPGKDAADRQQEMQIALMRANLAAPLTAALLPRCMEVASANARAEQGIEFDDGRPIQFNAAPAIDQATTLGLLTADTLLTKVGIR